MRAFMPQLHLLELQNIPIKQQLEWEEALLRLGNKNWCLINMGSSPAIVLGVSGKLRELVNSTKFQTYPVAIIRRFTGGGAVFIDEDTLFVTFIGNSADFPFQPFPSHIMAWTENIYRPLFLEHAFSLKENDYVLGKQKFGGNAQAIIKERWLHHTSLLWNYNPSAMDYLLFPSRTPQYRAGRSHEDFLCSLSHYFPTLESFKYAFINNLKTQFEVIKGSIKELEELALLPHRKATTYVLPHFS